MSGNELDQNLGTETVYPGAAVGETSQTEATGSDLGVRAARASTETGQRDAFGAGAGASGCAIRDSNPEPTD